MDKICCLCGRFILDSEDYDRIGLEYCCELCSNNNHVPCPICGTPINPDTDTEFQAPNGTLFCSQKCFNVVTAICMDCGNRFFRCGEKMICPTCIINNHGDEYNDR